MKNGYYMFKLFFKWNFGLHPDSVPDINIAINIVYVQIVIKRLHLT